MKNKFSKEHSFWERFNNIHLYPTKAEALFKAAIITISWIGGVHYTVPPEQLTNEIGAAFYLFSLALIMEYVVRLATVKKFMSKLFPFLIVTFGVIVFMLSSAVLLDRPFDAITYEFLGLYATIPQFIIWFDVVTMILIEPVSKKTKPIENTLKGCGEEEADE